MSDNLTEINKQTWNKRVEEHVKSDFYGLPDFLKGKSTLNDLELGLLGDIEGKSILHLQCHFGMDTLSLARLGAKVTGIDFADVAIEKAKNLAAELDINAEFICCNVTDLPKYLDRKFDIVFTSYGVIGWLPDLDAWGGVIKHFLKPNGSFLLVEFHPILWMFDEEYQTIKYPYSSKEVYRGFDTSYTGNSTERNEEISWIYGLSDVFRRLMNNGLKIVSFDEYDFSPYNLFEIFTEDEPGKYRVKGKEKLFPLLFSVCASIDDCQQSV